MSAGPSKHKALSAAMAQRIEAVCNRFEAAWLAGQRPRLESYLDTVPEAAQALLLRHLIALEIDFRRRAGEMPQAAEYQARFPGLTSVLDDLRDAPVPGGSAAADRRTTWPVIPGYEVLGELGRGGMGVVYRVFDPDLRRRLAVKVLGEPFRGKAEAESRLRVEAQLMGQLQHPGITPVHQVGRLADGRPFFAMKLVQGRTLAALLQERRDPRQEQARWLAIFAQVCQAVAYAHSKGVIHRDLKPSNIMVGAFGEVQVMDWGLAKVLAPKSQAAEAAAPPEAPVGNPPQQVRRVQSGGRDATEQVDAATHAGRVLGTPAYMAPEQARGEIDQLDERCDVFGLGAILCEILTGQPPYGRADHGEAWRQARLADLEAAQARLADCGADAALTDLARRCLAEAPAERPRDAGAVAAALMRHERSAAKRLRQAELKRVAAKVQATAERKTQQVAKAEGRKRRRVELMLAAAVVALIIQGAGIAWWRARLQEDTEHVVNAAYDDAVRLRTQASAAPVGEPGPWIEAVAAARRAEGLLATGLASAPTANRVRKLRLKVELEASHARLAATSAATRRATAEMIERVRRLQAERAAQAADRRQR
jgi:serine/threonine-protein kinase